MPTPPGADRNLLFGILALQMDFISRDALIAAMNAWVLDKARPLGGILLQQQALSSKDHDLLETLVDRHLHRHDNDPHQSLAAVLPLGSTGEYLQQIADADLHASLAHLPNVLPMEEHSEPTQDFTTGTVTSSGARFRVLRPHARGGLGEVFVAHDTELHREVALKEIQDCHADNPASRARFVLEAEITGRLEHPGIVPVYGLGQYADGRPYYAMRFIKGDSLHQAIQRFHRAEGMSAAAGERALELRQLLGRFVAACNAIAYAHSRGVLHRDLKPGNIMLGPYGETMVVDWGLAKPLGQSALSEPGLESILQPIETDNGLRTQMGSILGTPEFMSPEQAAGKLDEMGPASDVYSLGATLYCLLTGKAPFADQDKGKVLQQVQRGDFLPPRELKPEVSSALEAVCVKAMSLRSADRYPTPRDLAADVERWLADEPVGAWREPWRVRAGRWMRRHQKMGAAIAAGVLVTVLAAGSGLWWLDRLRTEQRRGVEAALAEVAKLKTEGRWGEARAVLGQAEDRLGAGGPHDLRDRLEQGRRELDLVARLDAIRMKRAAVVKGSEFDDLGAGRAYEQTMHEAGLAPVGSDSAAAAEWVSASGVRDVLVAVLDDWAGCTESSECRAWLLEVARRADPDPWRDVARQPATWEDAAALTRLADNPRFREQSPQLVTALAQQLDSLGGKAETLLRPAQLRHPQDFWVNLDLGNALLKHKPREAIAYYRAALALRPGAAAVYRNLGNALDELGQLDEAIATYRKAIELDPQDADAHFELGISLRSRGCLEEAIAACRKAIELDPDSVNAHVNLGVNLHDKGHFEEAIAAYRKAIELDAEDVDAHFNLGNALHAQNRLDGALIAYQKAITLDPRYVKAHKSLGSALQDKGRLDEAIAAYRKAIELDSKDANLHVSLGNALHAQNRLDRAIIAYRKAIALEPRHALAHYNLGAGLYDKGHLEEAIAAYRKAIELDPRYANAHYNLGNALRTRRQLDEAIAAFRKAIQLDPKFANAYNNLGSALSCRDRLDEAIVAYRQALRIDPQHTLARKNLIDTERMRAADGKLAAVVSGLVHPEDADEQLALAHLCVVKKLNATAACLYRDAFAVHPRLTDDPAAGHRYNAAFCAVLASAGQGQDAAPLSDPQRSRLRQQALRWLRADLAFWSTKLKKGTPQEQEAARNKLRHWQRDLDLASVRDPALLARLPEAERADYRKLWEEVAALLGE